MNDAANENLSDDQGAKASAAGRLMREALRASLQREVEDAEGRKARRLDLVVDALVGKAVAGDIAAVREVFDRLGGKPAPGVRPPPEPRKYIISWKGDEP